MTASIAEQGAPPKGPSSSRWRPISAVVLGLIFATSSVGLYVSRSGLLLKERPNRFQADVVADWLTAKAAIDGLDPYQAPALLSQHYRIDYNPAERPGSNEGEHFRPPGALLLLTPITRANPNDIFAASVLVNAGLFLFLALIATRVLGVKTGVALLLSPLGIVAIPVFQTFEWGAQSLMVAVLIAGAWLSLRHHDSTLGGILIALAATLKLYPVLLAIPLFACNRRRAGWTLLSLVAALQLAGAAILPGVSFARALRGLSAAGEAWGTFEGNASIAGVLARGGLPWNAAVLLALALGIGLLYASRTWVQDFEGRFVIALFVATMISPLSWTHYDVVLLVAAGWLLLRRLPARLAVAVGAGVVVWLFSWPIILEIAGPPGQFSMMSLGARVMLLGTFLLYARSGSTDRAAVARS